MHWVVDGYNVIRRIPELADREAQEGLAAGRNALGHLLTNAAQRSRDRFTVIFDGARGGSRSLGGAGIAVIFSSVQKSADALLIEHAAPGITVVSDDRDVVDGARRAGARTLSVKEFVARIRGAGRRR
jgi:predicted RNA-binding protein with PIN domain